MFNSMILEVPVEHLNSQGKVTLQVFRLAKQSIHAKVENILDNTKYKHNGSAKCSGILELFLQVRILPDKLSIGKLWLSILAPQRQRRILFYQYELSKCHLTKECVY